MTPVQRLAARHDGLLQAAAIASLLALGTNGQLSDEAVKSLLADIGSDKTVWPFSPWQNGKAERMDRTIAQEWQYARAWESEAGRASALPAFIDRYNWDRPHSACGGLPPMSRVVGVNNLLAHNS